MNYGFWLSFVFIYSFSDFPIDVFFSALLRELFESLDLICLSLIGNADNLLGCYIRY